MEALVILPFVVVAFVLFVRKRNRQRQEQFDKQFPPISDREFVARCRPGTNPERALKVRRIVAKHLVIEYERIYPSSRFIEDLIEFD